MKLSQFISLLSAMLGAEEKTIRMIVRYLREAGLFTTGARGVNSPDITALDAVRVIIAHMASPSPSKAVKDVLYFGALQPDLRADQKDHTWPLGLDPNKTLEQALVDLLENTVSNYRLISWGMLRLSDTGDAWIEAEEYVQEYHHREQWTKMRDATDARGTDEGKRLRREGKSPLDEMESMARTTGTKVHRSAEYCIGDLHEIGFELLGWEVE